MQICAKHQETIQCKVRALLYPWERVGQQSLREREVSLREAQIGWF